VSVRPSDSTLCLNHLTSDIDFYVCVGHGISSPGSDTQSCRSRSEVKSELFATRVATATSYECRFMAVVAGFHCDVISCQLARRGVRCGRGQRQRRIPARVGVVTQSVWPWSFVAGSILVCNFYRTNNTVRNTDSACLCASANTDIPWYFTNLSVVNSSGECTEMIQFTCICLLCKLTWVLLRVEVNSPLHRKLLAYYRIRGLVRSLNEV